ncbi:hypothetical protein NA78x_005139 [Anatilimnocola sp. NA78]|uniref:hypothetical protein n=1 Tax=Anatilimnocola sp. NA78 TaxID=3415683 RepID=UPI003CE51452
MLQAGEVAADQLAFKCRKLPTIPKKGEIHTEASLLYRLCRRGGGDMHGWLKWWAYHWLSEESGHPPNLEVTVRGYGRVDVHCPEISIFLECGNTSPTHAINALKGRLCTQFIVLPFQRAAFENAVMSGCQKLKAFSFQLSR